MDLSSRMYFGYFVDCEPLREKSPGCGGPVSWEVSEQTVRKIREVFRSRDLLSALTINLTPEAAAAHSSMMREWHAEGQNVGIQPNVPGFRYPNYDRDLGLYSEEIQRQIIAEATEDFEKEMGFGTTTYCACCGSKSPCTYRLLYEAGYREFMSSTPGRYLPDQADRCSEGIFPYPHWANAAHHLLPGVLPLCVIPNSGDLTRGRGTIPHDMRSERPVTEDTHQLYRHIVDTNIELSALTLAPVRAVVGATHNTERVNAENVAYVLDYVLEAVARAGLELVPASMPDIRMALEEVMPVGT